MNSPAFKSEARLPWYRQRWPWLLISLPLSAVIAGGLTWYIAWKSNDGLVADDYYKQGMEINRSLESAETARLLGMQAALSYVDGRFVLRLSAEREISFPELVRLRIVSPVRAGDDRELTLKREQAAYSVLAPELPPGHWNLVLEDQVRTWKIQSAAVFPLQAEALLKP